MFTKKKGLIGILAISLLSAASAQAQGVVIQPVLNINPAPVYAPVPVYAGPVISTYDVRHRRHDWEYWHARQHEQWEHEHDRDHWHR